MSNKNNISRRGFLKTSGIVAGAVVAAGAAVSITDAEAASKQKAAVHSMPAPQQKQLRARIFFTDYQIFQTLAHATERIFPKDATGPGAIELAVPYFIDNQLAGAYGLNAREYLQGPFHPGTPQQNYQTPLIREDIFMQGLLAMNREANAKYKKDFTELSDSQKDEILRMFEKGEVEMDQVPSNYFFGLLKTATLAGVYADPIYNGNNNMDGWRMKKYPGAQMSYLETIMDKKFVNIDPLSLADMQ